ncbi:MAG: hypothetical protein IJE08_04005 [Clostridia bacterium]|nr:hypothetical protein [Clostridia bacterium]
MMLFDPNKPFFMGNLHTHTSNSDGRMAPEDVLDLYRAKGYDFIALTDHWKRTSGDAYLRDDMLVIPGIELDYTLPAQVIHLVGVGVDECILEAQRNGGPQDGINRIRRAGGRAILAHPAWSLNTVETIGCLKGLTATEIYNSVSGAPWNGDRADSTDVLDVAAAHGCLINTVAADDSHFYTGEECSSYIMLQTEELTQESVLSALDQGAYYATRGPRFNQIEVTEDEIRVSCGPVSQIIFHSDLFYVKGRTVAGEGITEAVYPIQKSRSESFVRIILVDEQGRRAWSNPIRVG